MTKTLSFLSGVVLLLSCQNPNTESLQAENEKLKRQVDSLIHQIPQYKCVAVSMPLEDTITLGETYFADNFMIVYDEDNPPRLSLYNEETDDFTDTVAYDYASSQLILTPSDTGIQKVRAQINQELYGKHYEMEMTVTYYVMPATKTP